MADDDDLAPILAAESSSSTAFGMYEWTPERALLTVAVEWLQAIYSASVAPHTKSRRGPKVVPLARPTTAVQRWARTQSRVRGRTMLDQLFPDDE